MTAEEKQACDAVLAERDARIESMKGTIMSLDNQRIASERGWKRVERERDSVLAQLAAMRGALERVETILTSEMNRARLQEMEIRWNIVADAIEFARAALAGTEAR